MNAIRFGTMLTTRALMCRTRPTVTLLTRHMSQEAMFDDVSFQCPVQYSNCQLTVAWTRPTQVMSKAYTQLSENHKHPDG